jgi:DNA-binding response OmpR family regulator/DNA-binding CsgD family transcriptional regulator
MYQMNQRTILIVDDQKEYLQSFMSIILEEGVPYKMLSATNGKMAIEIALKEQPDLIIMDWEMPVMNGIEAVVEIKKHTEIEDVPVIIASGIMVSSDDLKKAFEAGATDYIRKPVDSIEFLARVNSHLKMADYVKAIKNKEEEIMALIHEKYLQKTEHLETEMTEMLKRVYQLDQFKKNISEKLRNLKKNLNRNSNEIEQQVESILSEVDELTDRGIENYSGDNFFEESFVKTILEIHPDLTRNDVQLCCFLRKNMNTKEIAAMTFRSVNTIKVARSKLRQKLNLQGEDNLNTYLMQL